MFRERCAYQVLVYTGLMPDLEVAHGDAGEAVGGAPVLPGQQPLQHVDPVQVIVMAQERVQHEELPDGVQQVQALDEDVGRSEVVTIETTPDQATDLGDGMLHTDTAARPVISLRKQIPVQLVNYVPNSLFSDFKVARVLAHRRSLHNGRHIDARSLVQKPPYQRWCEGQKALEHQYERYPLVVRNGRALFLDEVVRKLLGDGDLHGQVVGV